MQIKYKNVILQRIPQTKKLLQLLLLLKWIS